MPTNYTIKSGDSLSQIAEDNNTTVAAILKANPAIKSADKIRQGQTIVLPAAQVKKEKPNSEIEYEAKQAYAESTFNPSAKSKKGAQGLFQFMPDTIKEYQEKTGDYGDPYDPEYNQRMRRWYMDTLLGRSYFNKPQQSDSVHHAKALAAYNWGEGNLLNYLNEQKALGVDIYNSWDWVNGLPEEPRNYVNFVLRDLDIKNTGKTKKQYNQAVQKIKTENPQLTRLLGLKSGGQINYINLFKSGNKIHIKPENKGKFTESAKKAGKSVQEHAHDVVNNPNSTEKQRKRAQFAINAKKWKHQQGGLLQFYIPKAQEGIKADTIQNTNQFLSTTQKELNKKKVETAEGKKYDLTQLLSTGAMPIFTMMYSSWKNPNNKPIVDWMKTPIKQEDYGKAKPI